MHPGKKDHDCSHRESRSLHNQRPHLLSLKLYNDVSTITCPNLFTPFKKDARITKLKFWDKIIIALPSSEKKHSSPLIIRKPIQQNTIANSHCHSWFSFPQEGKNSLGSCAVICLSHFPYFGSNEELQSMSSITVSLHPQFGGVWF